MRSEDVGEEADYLAKAQPRENPRAFRQVAREAFALEYGTTKDQQIADIVGRDKSRISQIFRHPEEAESHTIKHLVSFLKNSANRERVVAAWTRAYFPDATKPIKSSELVGDVVNERTRRRVDRMIREGRYATAAYVSMQAARKTQDLVLRETFLDRAYFARHRADHPGQAMTVVRAIAIRARQRGEPDREAAALWMRCRILTGLPDADASEILPVLDAAENLLLAVGEFRRKEYLTATPALIRSWRNNARITLMERGRIDRDEEFVRTLLARQLESARKSADYQHRFGGYYMAARCYLLLGETFSAQEALEKGFRSEGAKVVGISERAALLQSRIMAETATADERAKYLAELLANCVETSDHYHLRLADWDLARVQAERFPSVGSIL